MMVFDTGAFLAEGVRPIEPSRLAFALRTLARVLEIARPAIEKAPRWGWAAEMAVDVVIGACLSYADRLDATGINPDVHGWRTDEPSQDGWYLVTTGSGEVLVCLWRRNEWLDRSGCLRDVVAWQPLPPPYRGEA